MKEKTMKRWLAWVAALTSVLCLGALAQPSADAEALGSVEVTKQLSGVSADSADDAWAIGYDNRNRPFIEHWDGATWSPVEFSVRGTTRVDLYDVLAISPTDVWVVGDQWTHQKVLTLAAHWDGEAFEVVPTPNPDGNFEFLSAVSALAPDDIWAAGFGSTAGLIEHWDGSAWHVQKAPKTGLEAISALSDTSIWAGGGGELWYWNGTKWRLKYEGKDTYPINVSALSSTSVWSAANAYPRYQVYHWEKGQIGQRLDSCIDSYLGDVLAMSEKQVWVVGNCVNKRTGVYRAAIYRWDGTGWDRVDNPVIGSLNDLSASSAHDMWAVGTTGSKTLIERWNGSTWTVYQGSRS